jgi:hypothetical protein
MSSASIGGGELRRHVRRRVVEERRERKRRFGGIRHLHYLPERGILSLIFASRT